MRLTELPESTRFRSGGIVGALIGIFLCAFVHWFLTPFGAWFGFHIGHSFGELIQAARDRAEETKEWLVRKQRRLRARWRLHTRMPRKAWRSLSEYELTTPILGYLAHGITAPIRWARSIHSWFTHRETKVTALRFTFGVFYYGVILVGAVIFLNHMAETASPKPGIKELSYFFGGILLLAVSIMPPIMRWEEGGEEMYVEDLSICQEKGGIYYLLFNLYQALKTWVAMVLAGLTGLSYLALAGSLYIAFALVPAMAVWGSLRLLWKLASTSKTRLQLGAGVTTLVTCFSAWIFSSYLSSFGTTLAVALSTGVVVGELANLARKGLVFLFKNYESFREDWVKVSPVEYLRPANQAFTTGADQLGEFGRRVFSRV